MIYSTLKVWKSPDLNLSNLVGWKHKYFGWRKTKIFDDFQLKNSISNIASTHWVFIFYILLTLVNQTQSEVVALDRKNTWRALILSWVLNSNSSILKETIYDEISKQTRSNKPFLLNLVKRSSLSWFVLYSNEPAFSFCYKIWNCIKSKHWPFHKKESKSSWFSYLMHEG
jgi:hypothetical protein